MGERIREERSKLRMTQAELAERAEISTSFMGQIERADKILSLETLIKIANVLNVTVDMLLTESLTSELDNLTLEINRYLSEMNNDDKLFILNVIRSYALRQGKD